jgi:flagellar hook-basal body complex protein FliE
MNNPEARFDYAVDQLRYAVWNIFWNDNLTNGKELILQNIDDFKRYIEGIFDNTVEVQKQFFEKGAEEDMQKDEFSEVVKAALEPVTQALTDLTEKVSKMEQANVTPADPAVETPATAAAAEGTEDVTKSAEETKEPDIAEIVKSVINEAISPISKSIGELTTRVEKVESVKGVSKGLEPDSKVEKAADPWADLHIPGLG